MEFPLADLCDSRDDIYIAFSPTAHASAHTKGSWTEIYASLPFDIVGITLNTSSPYDNTDLDALMDVGVGASGSEVVLIPNIDVGIRNGGAGSWMIGHTGFFPLRLPKGSRLAIRSQCSVGGNVAVLYGQIHRARFQSPVSIQGWDTLGVSTTTGKGTTVVAPSATIGAWTELSASAPREYRYFVFRGYSDDKITCGIASLLGFGAASSEVTLCQAYSVMRGHPSSGRNLEPKFMGHGPCRIPKGSRIVVKCGNTGMGADRNFLYSFHGGY